ncbi:MAG: VWA domain-containing protein [Bacteroidales bacterium]|jgi:Ca-activated chloride channel family protein|nr:VWA domain-containing protein [Bacteroidales bacterium]
MQLFKFHNPEYLYLLLLIPVLLVIMVFNNRLSRKKIKTAGEQSLIKGLIPEFSFFRKNLKFFLQLMAFVFAVFLIARPQFGSRLEEVRREGVEVIIALDVSNSMMAEDIQPNRLERAKQAISSLVDKLRDDKIGLIVFAGDAYTQIPVTTDYVSAKMFLSSISPGVVPRQGTSLASAINLGMSSFSPAMDESKALIIITDGENHEEDPLPLAEEASEKGIVIHTIGIGSAAGVPVPVISGGRKDYLKDNEGNTVITRLDEDILREIAFATGGRYVRASNTNIGLNTIFDEISSMKQQELEGTIYTEYDDQFQVLAALALICLLMDILIMERRNRKLSKINLFDVRV